MLVTENLKKTYPSFHMDVSLKAEKGKITGLIGQNGAGKTTLFKAVLGLIHTDGGKAELFGRDIRDLSAEDKQNIGAVMAESGFSGYLTVGDVCPILKAFYRSFDESLFHAYCARLGLDEKKKIRELSSGMKAKLKIAAALTHHADFLVLDEPTSGLDVIARDDVLTMLREYMAEKEDRSILISSHISNDLESLCDDFYMIHEGKIILHEDTDRLTGSYALIKADPKSYEDLDKTYILRVRKEPYGYVCLTDQREFYRENYPDLVIERAGMDELIHLMIKGEKG